MKLEFPVEKSQRDFWTHYEVRGYIARVHLGIRVYVGAEVNR